MSGHQHDHSHGVTAETDRRWLGVALGLICGFMAIEVVVGLLAGSIALISDAAHMLTDAFAIVLALVAMRLAARPATGGFTFGLKRAEILSAQANGLTLLLLAVWLGYESVTRLVHPEPVDGVLVLATGAAGVVVNAAAAWSLGRANRASLNVESAYQHVLNDLYAFAAAMLAGLVILLTGFVRADALASLVVVALMVKAGAGLVRDSGRILLEAAPKGMDPPAVGADITAVPGVVEVHDLHIWLITSGQAALSAHVLVSPGADCHAVRVAVERLLADGYGITHTTLQVDHAAVGAGIAPHCVEAHGPVHR